MGQPGQSQTDRLPSSELLTPKFDTVIVFDDTQRGVHNAIQIITKYSEVSRSYTVGDIVAHRRMDDVLESLERIGSASDGTVLCYFDWEIIDTSVYPERILHSTQAIISALRKGIPVILTSTSIGDIDVDDDINQIIIASIVDEIERDKDLKGEHDVTEEINFYIQNGLLRFLPKVARLDTVVNQIVGAHNDLASYRAKNRKN